MTAAEAPAVETTAEEREAFERAREEAAKREEQRAAPDRYVDGALVAWAPQPGSQVEFMSCPLFECLYHGTRGPGKTDSLLMDFLQHVGAGHGDAWRGILFRQTYPQLGDAVAKSERWFRRIMPNARFNRQRMEWSFPTGEVLLFRHMKRREDYWNYHGHEYPWIAFEELTNWPDDGCYTSMFSCCRSATPGVPRKVRATTNPYGVGHDWVKQRFRLGGEWWRTQIQRAPKHPVTGELEPARVAIHGHLRENKILLAADPNYERTVTAAATNEAMAKAWRDGRWDVVTGGMFGDVWSPSYNVVAPFAIPATWRVDRSFDWGSSKPFSVGWWAESDGSDLVFPDGMVLSTVRGDLFRISEWYGWTGRANEGTRSLATDIAKGIVERELAWGFRRPGERKSRVKPGPADSSIFGVENGRSIAIDMEKPVRIDSVVYPGVTWTHADKRPGSRVAGWEQMRQMMKAAHRTGAPRETPGLFVVGERCDQFLRTVLTLPRDEIKLDDVDTDAEDHIGDETRYRVRASGARARSGRVSGLT